MLVVDHRAGKCEDLRNNASNAQVPWLIILMIYWQRDRAHKDLGHWTQSEAVEVRSGTQRVAISRNIFCTSVPVLSVLKKFRLSLSSKEVTKQFVLGPFLELQNVF